MIHREEKNGGKTDKDRNNILQTHEILCHSSVDNKPFIN